MSSTLDSHDKLKEGNYPDLFYTNLDVLIEAETLILIRQYLRTLLKAEPQLSQKHEITFEGAIEIDKEQIGNLTINIPIEQIRFIKEINQDDKEEDLEKSAGQKLEYYTRKETADILQVSLPTLNKWTNQGEIKSFKIGSRKVRYKKKDIEKLLVEKKVIRF